MLSAFGFQPVAVPVLALTCAILFLVTEPFTVVKSPPKYTFVLSTAIALTIPFVFGFQDKI